MKQLVSQKQGLVVEEDSLDDIIDKYSGDGEKSETEAKDRVEAKAQD